MIEAAPAKTLCDLATGEFGLTIINGEKLLAIGLQIANERGAVLIAQPTESAERQTRAIWFDEKSMRPGPPVMPLTEARVIFDADAGSSRSGYELFELFIGPEGLFVCLPDDRAFGQHFWINLSKGESAPEMPSLGHWRIQRWAVAVPSGLEPEKSLPIFEFDLRKPET